MKRGIITVVLASAAGLLVALGMQAPAQAWSPAMKGGETVTVAEGETHKGSLYATGSTIKIEGDVEGDVYCAAQKVEISGAVSGNISCAAQEIVFSGTAEQSARFAAMDIKLGGEIAGDVSLAAQTATVREASEIGGDLNGYTQELTVDGTVTGGLRLAAEKITVNGTVVGSSDLSTRSLRFGENGQFEGNLYYSSAEEISINTGNVAGTIEHHKAEGSSSRNDILMTLILVIGTFIFTGLAVAAMLPQFVERSSRLAKGNVIITLLTGSAALFVVPVVAMLLFISYFGIMLGVILLLAWVLMILLSGVFFAYYLGAIMLPGSQHILIRMLGGVVLLSALWLIPVLQIVAIFATAVMGSGLLLRALFHKQFGSHTFSLAPPLPRPPMPVSLGGPKESRLETPQPIETTPAPEPKKKPTPRKKAPPKDKE